MKITIKSSKDKFHIEFLELNELIGNRIKTTFTFYQNDIFITSFPIECSLDNRVSYVEDLPLKIDVFSGKTFTLIPIVELDNEIITEYEFVIYNEGGESEDTIEIPVWWNLPEWSWYQDMPGSSSTKEQRTLLANNLLEGRPFTNYFISSIWNDLVNKVDLALYTLDTTWSPFDHFATYEESLVSQGSELTAEIFNALTFNLFGFKAPWAAPKGSGFHGAIGRQEVVGKYRLEKARSSEQCRLASFHITQYTTTPGWHSYDLNYVFDPSKEEDKDMSITAKLKLVNSISYVNPIQIRSNHPDLQNAGHLVNCTINGREGLYYVQLIQSGNYYYWAYYYDGWVPKNKAATDPAGAYNNVDISAKLKVFVDENGLYTPLHPLKKSRYYFNENMYYIDGWAQTKTATSGYEDEWHYFDKYGYVNGDGSSFKQSDKYTSLSFDDLINLYSYKYSSGDYSRTLYLASNRGKIGTQVITRFIQNCGGPNYGFTQLSNKANSYYYGTDNTGWYNWIISHNREYEGYVSDGPIDVYYTYQLYPISDDFSSSNWYNFFRCHDKTEQSPGWHYLPTGSKSGPSAEYRWYYMNKISRQNHNDYKQSAGGSKIWMREHEVVGWDVIDKGEDPSSGGYGYVYGFKDYSYKGDKKYRCARNGWYKCPSLFNSNQKMWYYFDNNGYLNLAKMHQLAGAKYQEYEGSPYYYYSAIDYSTYGRPRLKKTTYTPDEDDLIFPFRGVRTRVHADLVDRPGERLDREWGGYVYYPYGAGIPDSIYCLLRDGVSACVVDGDATGSYSGRADSTMESIFNSEDRSLASQSRSGWYSYISGVETSYDVTAVNTYYPQGFNSVLMNSCYGAVPSNRIGAIIINGEHITIPDQIYASYFRCDDYRHQFPITDYLNVLIRSINNPKLNLIKFIQFSWDYIIGAHIQPSTQDILQISEELPLQFKFYQIYQEYTYPSKLLSFNSTINNVYVHSILTLITNQWIFNCILDGNADIHILDQNMFIPIYHKNTAHFIYAISESKLYQTQTPGIMKYTAVLEPDQYAILEQNIGLLFIKGSLLFDIFSNSNLTQLNDTLSLSHTLNISQYKILETVDLDSLHLSWNGSLLINTVLTWLSTDLIRTFKTILKLNYLLNLVHDTLFIDISTGQLNIEKAILSYSDVILYAEQDCGELKYYIDLELLTGLLQLNHYVGDAQGTAIIDVNSFSALNKFYNLQLAITRILTFTNLYEMNTKLDSQIIDFAKLGLTSQYYFERYLILDISVIRILNSITNNYSFTHKIDQVIGSGSLNFIRKMPIIASLKLHYYNQTCLSNAILSNIILRYENKLIYNLDYKSIELIKNSLLIYNKYVINLNLSAIDYIRFNNLIKLEKIFNLKFKNVLNISYIYSGYLNINKYAAISIFTYINQYITILEKMNHIVFLDTIIYKGAKLIQNMNILYFVNPSVSIYRHLNSIILLQNDIKLNIKLNTRIHGNIKIFINSSNYSSLGILIWNNLHLLKLNKYNKLNIDLIPIQTLQFSYANHFAKLSGYKSTDGWKLKYLLIHKLSNSIYFHIHINRFDTLSILFNNKINIFFRNTISYFSSLRYFIKNYNNVSLLSTQNINLISRYRLCGSNVEINSFILNSLNNLYIIRRDNNTYFNSWTLYKIGSNFTFIGNIISQFNTTINYFNVAYKNKYMRCKSLVSPKLNNLISTIFISLNLNKTTQLKNTLVYRLYALDTITDNSNVLYHMTTIIKFNEKSLINTQQIKSFNTRRIIGINQFSHFKFFLIPIVTRRMIKIDSIEDDKYNLQLVYKNIYTTKFNLIHNIYFYNFGKFKSSRIIYFNMNNLYTYVKNNIHTVWIIKANYLYKIFYESNIIRTLYILKLNNLYCINFINKLNTHNLKLNNILTLIKFQLHNQNCSLIRVVSILTHQISQFIFINNLNRINLISIRSIWNNSNNYNNLNINILTIQHIFTNMRINSVSILFFNNAILISGSTFYYSLFNKAGNFKNWLFVSLLSNYINNYKQLNLNIITLLKLYSNYSNNKYSNLLIHTILLINHNIKFFTINKNDVRESNINLIKYNSHSIGNFCAVGEIQDFIIHFDGYNVNLFKLDMLFKNNILKLFINNLYQTMNNQLNILVYTAIYNSSYYSSNFILYSPIALSLSIQKTNTIGKYSASIFSIYCVKKCTLSLSSLLNYSDNITIALLDDWIWPDKQNSDLYVYQVYHAQSNRGKIYLY